MTDVVLFLLFKLLTARDPGNTLNNRYQCKHERSKITGTFVQYIEWLDSCGGLMMPHSRVLLHGGCMASHMEVCISLCIYNCLNDY